MKVIDLVDLIFVESERLAELVSTMRRIFGDQAEVTVEMIDEARRALPEPLKEIKDGN